MRAQRGRTEIERGRTLSRASAGVVVGAVARTEVAVVIARLGRRHAAEVRADADQHQPLVFACAVVSADAHAARGTHQV